MLHEYHDSVITGHPGGEETLRAITRSFHWPGLERDVTSYIKQCLLCANFKRRPKYPHAPLRPRQPTRPFKVISVDIMGPYPRSISKNRFIITATDLFTKWTEGFAVPASDAKTIGTKLENQIFRRFGYPRHIITDNGSQFYSVHWDSYCRRWHCDTWQTAIYHPRANPVERRNQEIKKGLRIRLDGAHPRTCTYQKRFFPYDREFNAATGQSPNLLLGYNAPEPGGWDQPNPIQPEAAEDRHQRARDHQVRYIRRRHGRVQPPRITYREGDQVLVRRNPAGLKRAEIFGPTWEGSATVIRAAGRVTYWVNLFDRETKLHVDQMRRVPEAAPQPMDDYQ